MYNYWQIAAENGRKVPLASNQVVGSSNLSGRAKVIKDLAHFRKIASAQSNKNIKVVISDCETMIALNQTSER